MTLLLRPPMWSLLMEISSPPLFEPTTPQAFRFLIEIWVLPMTEFHLYKIRGYAPYEPMDIKEKYLNGGEVCLSIPCLIWLDHLVIRFFDSTTKKKMDFSQFSLWMPRMLVFPTCSRVELVSILQQLCLLLKRRWIIHVLWLQSIHPPMFSAQHIRRLRGCTWKREAPPLWYWIVPWRWVSERKITLFNMFNPSFQ